MPSFTLPVILSPSTLTSKLSLMETGFVRLSVQLSLLPELLPDKLLSWGNGILELTTFVAIIAGAVIGPSLAQHFHGREAIAGLIFGACSLFGLAASFGVSRVPPADPSKKFSFNIFGDLRKQIQLVRPDRVLHLAIAGNTYFWFLGALLVLTRMPTVPLDSDLLVGLSVGLPVGLGIYFAWVHRDWPARTKATGLSAALGGALVGAWLGFHAGAGLLAVITTIVGAAVGANLTLIAFDIIRDRSVTEVAEPSQRALTTAEA